MSLGKDDLNANDGASDPNVYRSSPSSADDRSARRAFRYRTFKCPRCGTELSATKDDVGKTFVCPDCETKVVVPNDLDFDTETEFERRYFDEEKRRRDRIMSPARNPNRVGIDLADYDLYGLQGETNEPKKDEEVYYPVHCPVCETLMQAPSSMLGQEIVCPDCGTKTIVAKVVKDYFDGLDVRFDPVDRGVYEIGEIPDAPDVAIQGSDGRTTFVGKKDETIAPTRTEEKVSSGRKKERAQKKKDAASLEEELARELRSERSKTFLGGVVAFFERRRRDREALEEDPSQFLPAQVLRRRDGKLVWTLASPPRTAPLFNRTFRAAFTEDIWARGGLVAFLLFIPALLCAGPLASATSVTTEHYTSLARSVAEGELLALYIALLLLTLFGSSLTGLFFWSVYNCGNSGASRVVEWRKEDLQSYFVFGAQFALIVAVSFVPGVALVDLLGAGVEGGLRELWRGELESLDGLLVSSACYFGSFWLFFPVFWISTIQKDWPFCPITFNVLTSFISKFGVWTQFYLTSALFFFIPTVLWGAVADKRIFWFVAPVVVLLVSIFYGLLLGRLSWILDDEIRHADFDD